MDSYKMKYLLIALLISILFASCDARRVFDENIGIEEEGWNRNNKAKFEVVITDTISLHNFYINLRNTSDYAKRNIYLYIKTTFPNNRVAIDTLAFFLADKEGKWLGKGIGRIKDNRILFKAGVIFPYKGKYLFEIEQGMRYEVLEGVIDVGLRIEKQ